MITLGDGRIEKLGIAFEAPKIMDVATHVRCRVSKAWPEGFLDNKRLRIGITSRFTDRATWRTSVGTENYQYLTTESIKDLAVFRKNMALLLLIHRNVALDWHTDPGFPHLRILTNLDEVDAVVLVAREWDREAQGWLIPGLCVPESYDEVVVAPGESYIVDNTPDLSTNLRTPHAVPKCCTRFMLQNSLNLQPGCYGVPQEIVVAT